jgi:hypothetical protein
MKRAKVAGVLCALAGVGVMVAGVGPAGAEAEDRIPAIGAATKAVDACTASFPADAFAKVASVAEVAPGQPVAVDVTWRPAWYSADTVDVLGCVAANGRFVAGSVERGVDTGTGLWVHKFAVPADAAKDIAVCQAAVVFSTGSDGNPTATRSDPDCFTVTAASTSEAAPAAESADPGAGAGKETAVTAPTPPPVAAMPPKAAATNAAPAAAATPAPRTAAAAPAPKPATAAAAVPPTQLPHTGAAERLLVAAAGILLAIGGWAVGFGAGRRRTVAAAIRSTLQ